MGQANVPAKPIGAGPQILSDDTLRRISHDIRASLRAVKELPEWISEDLEDIESDLPETVPISLNLIRSHARRLELMLDGFLCYARAGRGRLDVVTPAAALAQALERLDFPAAAKLSVQLPDVNISISSEDFSNLFAEVISNCIRHNLGDVSIEVSGVESKEYLEVSILDNGPGIALENREQVCLPLTKLKSRDDDEGAGMGLAIASRIAQCWGGRLTLEEPEAGKEGTLVRVALPLCTATC